MWTEKIREHKERNTSPIVSINTIKNTAWRLGGMLAFCAFFSASEAYIGALAFFILTLILQLLFDFDRFLLKRYGWYRIWIASIYSVHLLAALLNWLTNTILWIAPAVIYSTFIAEHLFTKQLAALKAEHHIPQEIED